MGEPSGRDPLDDEIRAAQKRARSLSGSADSWVLVGRAWVRKARLSYDPGYYLNASACAEVALDIEPRHRSALQLQVLSLLNEHKFAEAQRVSEQILAGDAQDPVALGTLSDALLEQGRFEDSLEAAQKMLDSRPDMASYSRASYLRWLKGDNDGAKVLIKKALQTGRDARDAEAAAWTFTEAAKIYWNEADYEGAEAVFLEATRWVNDYAPALAGLARIALGQGKAGRAVELLERSFAKSPLAETAWLLGDAYSLQGDEKKAESWYARVVTEGKKGDRLTLAAFWATKNREPAEALRLIVEERKERGGIYIDDVHAWALYRLGRLDEAKEKAASATKLGTRDARLLYHAGVIRMASGDSGGRGLVEKALSYNPHFDVTGEREARKLLEAR